MVFAITVFALLIVMIGLSQLVYNNLEFSFSLSFKGTFIIGVGKRLLNFIGELYSSQTKLPFYILTSNPQIIRGDMKNWKITRFGHASQGKDNTRINNELRSSLSRERITVSMLYTGNQQII